jgi:hypothetical protein
MHTCRSSTEPLRFGAGTHSSFGGAALERKRKKDTKLSRLSGIILSDNEKGDNMESKLFDAHGWFTGTLPEDCVHDCSGPGPADEAVEYWRGKLAFQVPVELAIRYLREFGAWDDLLEAGQEVLSRRCLWIACGEIKESGEWLGLVH